MDETRSICKYEWQREINMNSCCKASWNDHSVGFEVFMTSSIMTKVFRRARQSPFIEINWKILRTDEKSVLWKVHPGPSYRELQSLPNRNGGQKENQLIRRFPGFTRSSFLIYLLTAIVLTPGGSSTVHIYTQNISTEQYKETEYPEGNIKIRICKHNITIHNLTIRIYNLQN